MGGGDGADDDLLAACAEVFASQLVFEATCAVGVPYFEEAVRGRVVTVLFNDFFRVVWKNRSGDGY